MDQSKFTATLSKFFIGRLHLLISYSVWLGAMTFGLLYLATQLFTHFSSSLPFDIKQYVQIGVGVCITLLCILAIKRIVRFYNYFNLLLGAMLNDLVKMADLLQTVKVIDVGKLEDIPDIIQDLKNQNKKTIH